MGNLGENFPKVSGPSAEYSRFRETLRGDFFDRHYMRGAAAEILSLAAAIPTASTASSCLPANLITPSKQLALET